MEYHSYIEGFWDKAGYSLQQPDVTSELALLWAGGWSAALLRSLPAQTTLWCCLYNAPRPGDMNPGGKAREKCQPCSQAATAATAKAKAKDSSENSCKWQNTAGAELEGVYMVGHERVI